MLSFDNAAALAAAPTTASIDPALRQLIADRIHDWTATDLLDLTHLLVVQPGDAEEHILDAVAFSPLVNQLDDRRYGQKGFTPSLDWLEQHDGWFELIFTVGNDGFAFVLFVEDREGVDPELRSMCRQYSASSH